MPEQLNVGRQAGGDELPTVTRIDMRGVVSERTCPTGRIYLDVRNKCVQQVEMSR